MKSVRELQEWCRSSCSSYSNVHIRDLSSSFRDGLAFCAIIHTHRPDLIEFSSLSKCDAFHNNKLAFEVAETKLGIPSLLDPKDVASSEVPDRFGVITYLSQYYYFFSRKNRAVPAKSISSHISVLNHLTRSRTFENLKPSKNAADTETPRGDRFSNVNPRAVCRLCLRPVHLIQRHVADGEVYHRTCFRCKVCSIPLLPESYTQGSDPGSLICTYHITDGKSSHQDLSQRAGNTNTELQGQYRSLSGTAISSVPVYSKKTDPGRGREESCRPIPAPRRMLEQSAAPVPAPRIKAVHTGGNTDGLCSANKSPSRSSHSTSPKVQSNHPWMAIVHPGPWTQLPPAPPPVPVPRTKRVCDAQQPWQQTTIPSPNPFEEEEAGKEAAATQSEAEAVVCARSDEESHSDPQQFKAEKDDSTDVGGACGKFTGNGNDPSSNLSRSLSVPAIIFDHVHTHSDVKEEQETLSSCQSKGSCKENPFNQKPAMAKSKTFSDLLSSRGPAPGHGFPLIKRKVQTDHLVPTENLQLQLSELHKHLEAVEQRGIELERRLRDCCYDQDKEEMLTEWFSLVHQRHVLSYKDTELVYQLKQQKLDDRQSDVEYELRCLLNKPEGEWSRDDRGREQQLMEELVAVIDQRNQIINSLDRDRQREREQDEPWDGRVTNKVFQKRDPKELKKSKGKFKPTKVLKLLTHKAGSTKESTEKKS
ncbi:MICAL-like protein 1 isoform X2 [Gouania willdenowi]|uniref:MICAL-like protein 1 isoform X2 n=1 Tax=Gouania willdenowi TaxID=441366 RepID=UPI001054520D|nr:MICAL-like protein 1 isoform X2 [Gouania willdenowi]